MSAMTESRTTSHRTGEPSRPRLLTAPLARVLAASFGALSSFYLLLSVIPMLATSAGSDGSAGIVTGVLMFGGVLAELATPRLMARLGARRVLAIGLVLLGTPALLLIASEQLAVVVAVCAVRGLGFGLTVVASGSLVVSLVPPERRGEGLGVFGVVASAPGIVALPAGVWLADHAGYPLVFALAALVALGGLAAQIGSSRPSEHEAQSSADKPAGLLDGLRAGSQMRLALAFVATTVAAGVVVAFLPLAGISSAAGAGALLVQAVAATVGRWAAGRHGDRKGHSRLLVPALVTTAAGMTLLAGAANPVMLMLGAALFGVGFGATQCVTLAMMIERVDRSGYGMVNAVWNLAYDLGYGAGPVAFGALVGRTGYPAAFAVTGVLVLTALVPALRDRPRTRTTRVAAVALGTAAL
jgi:predicted MFS family arabinose efflux permease